jgi:hypothetical protein
VHLSVLVRLDVPSFPNAKEDRLIIEFILEIRRG